jgi:hypothetical protein
MTKKKTEEGKGEEQEENKNLCFKYITGIFNWS